MSATGAAFLTKQVPNVGFPGASKAVQSSQTTLRCPKQSISSGGLKTRNCRAQEEDTFYWNMLLPSQLS